MEAAAAWSPLRTTPALAAAPEEKCDQGRVQEIARSCDKLLLAQ